MKSILFPVLLFLLSSPGFPQQWAPVGATWHYTEFFFIPVPIVEDYILMESVKDTLYEGVQCRKIEKRHNLVCADRPDVEYMYEEDGKVWFWDPPFNAFQMVYDFNAAAGEGWWIAIKDYGDPADTDTLLVTVDSTDMATINGTDLKRLYVTYLFLNEMIPNYSYNSTIIESIGDTWYMFNWTPELGFVCDANWSGGLRCYEDPVIGLYETGIADSCEYVEFFESVNHPGHQAMKVYPNPAGSTLWVAGPAEARAYRILDITGAEVSSGQVRNGVVQTGGLEPGLYIIELSGQKGEMISRNKFLKK